VKALEFTKMHGAGNDFVVLDGTAQELPPLEAFSRRICDRHLGIGADQVLVVRAPDDLETADFRMDIYNADGSQVEMCANGIRAFYQFLRQRGHTSAQQISVETLSGIVRPAWAGPGQITVDMGPPVLVPAKIPTTLRSQTDGAHADDPVLDVPLDVGGETVRASCVSMGNPHAVVFVDDPDSAPVDTLGSAIENHPAFPNRSNVEFATPVGRSRIRQRTWERGTGETLACGSGACAVAVVSMLLNRVERSVVVELRGGELAIGWEGKADSVFMTGPAVEVFTGSYPLDPSCADPVGPTGRE